MADIKTALYNEWERYLRDREIDEPTDEDVYDFLNNVVIDQIEDVLEKDICKDADYMFYLKIWWFPKVILK